MATLVAKNPANDPDKKPVKSRSRFLPNRSLYQTLKFGLNQPNLAFEVVEGDKVSIRVKTDLDTLNMTAPLLTPVKMNKDYFFAPIRAILPHNAELLVTNPLTGDDIVPKDVNCVILKSGSSSFETYKNSVCSVINTLLSQAENAPDAYVSSLILLKALVIAVQFGDPFFSFGSLLNNMGANFAPLVYWLERSGSSKSDYSWDNFIELLCDTILSHVKSFTYAVCSFSNQSTLTPVAPMYRTINVDCEPQVGAMSRSSGTIDFRTFLMDLRQGTQVGYIASVVPKNGITNTPYTVLYPNAGTRLILQYGASLQMDYNISRLVAYQLACASFYTDDAVDYLYSCKLWHQNLRACFIWACNTNNALGYLSYVLNGTLQEYDAVSGACLNRIFNYVQTSLFDTTTLSASDTSTFIYNSTNRNRAYWVEAYIANIFGFTRSLKFRDYFVGSKVRPMAVGNVNVSVASNQFSVVDVTKNIQMQRFLNQVNRVGRKFNEYVQGIFGVTPPKDPTEVVFLGHTDEYIGSEETNETAGALLTDAQTTRTKMRRSSSQFAFEGHFSEPGVVVGIVNFDVARPYTTSADRAFFHLDRFDMFNPFLQHIGDQVIYGSEIDPMQQANVGYQLRYAEYKQSTDRAVGGFVQFLPGFAFLNDYDTLHAPGRPDVGISPDFIRSRPTEFDKFYNVMSHYSEAGYFHFFARHDIHIDASRPMEAAPSIL